MENIDVHVTTLREKLGEFSDYIQSVPGFGYRFKE
jgi:DNA-binding response OmpR family regulator